MGQSSGRRTQALNFPPPQHVPCGPKIIINLPSIVTKKCLKLCGSGAHEIPGTGSVCSVLVYLTTLGLGPSILLSCLTLKYQQFKLISFLYKLRVLKVYMIFHQFKSLFLIIFFVKNMTRSLKSKRETKIIKIKCKVKENQYFVTLIILLLIIFQLYDQDWSSIQLHFIYLKLTTYVIGGKCAHQLNKRLYDVSYKNASILIIYKSLILIQKWVGNLYIYQFQQMTQKSVDQKLQECKTVIIQNVEKTMHGTMIHRYLKEEKIDIDVEKFLFNSTGGFITVQFRNHEKAKTFYDKANFKDKILIRPFNIYFNVQLNDNEMIKYYFEGIAEQNMRKMFQLSRKVGVCKIYTNYTSASSNGKLKPGGVLSYVRKDPITQQEFNKLKQDLLTIGVKIFPYVPDKGLKCAILLTNFFSGDLNQSDEEIQKLAKTQATNLVKSLVKDFEDIANISITIKRKEVPSTENKEGSKTITKVKALVEFKDSESTINHFEAIRKGFIKTPEQIKEARAVLHFYTAEVNNFISLFSSGLEKKKYEDFDYTKLSDKEFEDRLVEEFRKINKDVIQVNVFPTRNNTYVARVYLKNEHSGREFIVDYGQKRDILIRFYKSRDNIRFDINTDDKTMKRMKQYNKKTELIMSNIKNDEVRQRNFNHNKGGHQVPLNQGFGMMMGQHPNIPNIPGIMNMPKNNIPMMAQMQNSGYPMMINPNMIGNIPPPNMGGMMNPVMGGLGQPKPQGNEMKDKIEKLYSKKDQYVDRCKDKEFEESLKKQTNSQVKYVLQNDIKLAPVDAIHQADQILQNNQIGIIIDFLKKPHEFYQKVFRSK